MVYKKKPLIIVKKEPIQIFKNYGVGDGQFIFKLTGSLGNVMKESVQCAFTAALEYIDNNKQIYKIKNITDHLKKNIPFGYHIHAPSGATPKHEHVSYTHMTLPQTTYV